MHQVFIAIGTNLGDKEKNIEDAISAVEEFCTVKQVATNIVTEPWGVTDQPDFLNTVIEVETFLKPLVLLAKLQEVEKEMGRVKLRKWGERIIDLDIIFYDDLVTDMGDLILPHPYMEDRDFVLKPLAEIAPYKVHPLLGKRVFRLLGELEK